MNINTSKDGWRRSSFCNGEWCVELRQTAAGEFHLRDSADPENVLRFTYAEWDAFVAGVEAGEFNPE